jgi:hypothetical protein
MLGFANKDPLDFMNMIEGVIKLVNSVMTKIDWNRNSIMKWLDINVMYKNIMIQNQYLVNYHYTDKLNGN